MIIDDLVSQWVGLIGSTVCLYLILKKAFPKESIENRLVNLFKEQNKIEEKLFIHDQFFVTAQTDQNIIITIPINNSSNQIINIQIDSNNTRCVIETSTHNKFPDLKCTIPPYSEAKVTLPPVSISSLENNKELKINIHILIKYGLSSELKLEAKKTLESKFLKEVNEKSEITYKPIA